MFGWLSKHLVPGSLINICDMKWIWTRGIKNANKFMIGAAIAYYLKKWMNYREKKVKAVTMEMMQMENQNEMNNIFVFFNQELFGKMNFRVY